MIVSNERDVIGIQLEDDHMKGVTKKVLIDPSHGWKGYVMRQFELCEGGYTSIHEHAWPHIIYILQGKGSIFIAGEDYEVEAGSFSFVDENIEHNLTNKGKGDFKFICIVPEEGDK